MLSLQNQQTVGVEIVCILGSGMFWNWKFMVCVGSALPNCTNHKFPHHGTITVVLYSGKGL